MIILRKSIKIDKDNVLMFVLAFLMLYYTYKKSSNNSIYIYFYLVNLIIISFVDLKTQIINNRFICLLFMMSFFESILTNDFTNFYLSAGMYVLPVLILFSAADMFEKEVMGFGDIKLMICIGSILRKDNIIEVFIFYKYLYIISGGIIFVLLIFGKIKKTKYIPFAPFICLTYYYLGVFS